MKTIRQTVSLLCLLALLSVIVLGQAGKGSLSGTVLDGNGAAIANAKVMAKQDATGQVLESSTTSAGLYAFPTLDVGVYTLTIEARGFKKSTRTNLTVGVSNRTVGDFTMQAGDVNDSVTISSDGPALQTQTTEIGYSFSPKLFKDAPIYASGIRNPEAFIGFQAGVVNGAGAEGGISGGARRSKEILIDGANATNPESGGVAFNGLPSVEALGEFKLINNTFAAEYGRTGGGIESFVTASGGNQFHGNVFNFHSSSALSANVWATNATPLGAGVKARKLPYHGNEYGFSLGGPVYLPKKIFGPVGGYNEDKSKTFFFFTVDNFRRSSATAGFRNMPTAKQLQGDFSELLPRAIWDPVTNQAFPGNIIPQNRFSSVSRNILGLLPQPTTSGLTANYLATTLSQNKQDSWSLKINHNISNKHLIAGYFTKQSLESLTDGPLPAPLLGANGNAVAANRPIFARFNYTWIVSDRTTIEATYGITELRQYFDNQSVGQGWPQKLGLKGVADGETSAFPVVNFSDGRYTNLADTNGTKTKGTQFNLTDHVRADLSMVRGNFNWKFGIDHRWMRTTGEPLPTGGFDDAGVQGVFAFSPLQTANPAATGTTGDSFASFLLGQVDTASRTYNANASSANFGYHAWYGQADWRLRPNITVNLGMRYEIPIPRSTSPTAFTSFDPNLADPRSGLKGALAYLGDCAGCVKGNRFGEIDYSSFGPRLGLAWSMNQKTVLRVGYGMYYAAGNGLTGGFCIRCQNGYSNTAGLSRPTATGAALNWDNGFVPPPNFLPPPIISASAGNAADDIWYISPNSGTAPRFQNWSLSLQRELPFKLLFEAAYIGNRGTRLSANHNPLNHLDPKFYALGALLNQRIDAPAVVAAGYKTPYANFITDWGAGATLARALRPFPHINGPVNNEYNPIGSSWYDSLQLKLDRRFGNLFLEANYTWSKALTNASGSQTSGDSNNRNPKSDNPYDPNVLQREKSYQYTDYPHIFNVVGVLDLPFGKGKRFLSSGAVVDRVFGGWSVSFTGSYTSGALILLNAPALTYPNWGFAYGRKRVNFTGQEIQTGVNRRDLDPRNTNIRWINPGLFSIPGTFELGNAPVYHSALRDPNAFNDNMGFIKRTRITETIQFELRGEFFNIFNRTNFGIGGAPARPNTADLVRFGVPNGPRTGARLGQVVAKITF
ncbi:MAG: carboxypeptidase regulatory-like domain-containing protein [Blastocatellia bacterium]